MGYQCKSNRILETIMENLLKNKGKTHKNIFADWAFLKSRINVMFVLRLVMIYLKMHIMSIDYYQLFYFLRTNST